MKTVHIMTDGTVQPVTTQPGHAFQEFTRITGIEWTEFVYTQEKGIIVVCDEMGLLKKDSKINPLASYLYGTHKHGHPIVGDVILMKPVMTSDGPDFDFFEDTEIPALIERLKGLASKIPYKFTFKEEEAK